MADFPTAVTSFATLVDYVDWVLASHHNLRAAEIVATQTELGTLPKGAFSDVKTRLLTMSLPPGMMRNGKISVTVASNNLTVSILTSAGATPSASDPVVVNIGGTDRLITAALSVTIAAGANTFNAGSAELATLEIDYFVYLGYNATDGVVIGPSRIPYATLYSDFSATSTNEKYCAISTITNAAAGDDYVNIGRFAATLSAGAGYTWTVPTFTSANLIQKPVYETKFKTFVPTRSGFSTIPTGVYKYKIVRDMVYIATAETADGVSNATTKSYSLPFIHTGSLAFIYFAVGAVKDNGTIESGGVARVAAGNNNLEFFRTAFAAWTNSGNCRMYGLEFYYPITQ